MGVVHDGHDVAVRIGVHLHAAGDPGLHQPHIDGPLRDVQPLAHGDGGQGVLHVEQAGHGQPELPGKAAGTHPEQDVVAPLAYLGGVDVRLRVLLGEGDDLAAARLRRRPALRPACSQSRLTHATSAWAKIRSLEEK